MTKLETLKNFLSECPYLENTPPLCTDVCGSQPGSQGLIPTEETVLERGTDSAGGIALTKLLTVAYQTVQPAATDSERQDARRLLESLADWLEAQSAQGLAPAFGDRPEADTITAQNGKLLELSEGGTIGKYQLQILIQFTKEFERMI